MVRSRCSMLSCTRSTSSSVGVALLDKSTKLREVSNRIAALPSAASIKAPVALGEYCLGADAVEEYRCAK